MSLSTSLLSEAPIVDGPGGPDRVVTRKRHEQIFAQMKNLRSPWFAHWRTISEYFIPRRYPTLSSSREHRTVDRRNRRLLTSVSTRALRTLATGLQDGITSPARPWFNLRVEGFTEEGMTRSSRIWLEEVAKRMRTILAESNFYDSLAILYLDWCAFGTACMDVRADFDEVVRFYNYGPGEFYLTQDAQRRINRVGRDFEMTVEQMVEEFGEENVRAEIRDKFNGGGAGLLDRYPIIHIIEHNNREDGLLRGTAKYREVYWDASSPAGEYLAVRPFSSWPAVTPRWEIVGDDVYAVSPAMEALPDVMQLQEMIKIRNMGLDKVVRPPMIVDQQLRNRPKALSAAGITYASTANSNFGAKPVFQVNLPLQYMNESERELAIAVQETMFNQLFAGISQLETVRSATEIVARDQERLVLLGPVLGRFENEGLDVILTRTYDLANRAGLFPEPPEEIAEAAITVQYVSILSDAQRAVGTASTERFMAFSAEVAGVYPEVRNLPNATELLRDYAERTGVPAVGLNSREEVARRTQAEAQASQAREAAELGATVAQGAQSLSQTDVGGGINALQAVTR